jgi:hypothetical protein
VAAIPSNDGRLGLAQPIPPLSAIIDAERINRDSVKVDSCSEGWSHRSAQRASRRRASAASAGLESCCSLEDFRTSLGADIESGGAMLTLGLAGHPNTRKVSSSNGDIPSEVVSMERRWT